MGGLLRALVPHLAYAYMTLVGRTARWRWEGLEHLQELERRGSGFIYAFWHERQVLFTYTHRGSGAHILVSRSRDGELIAETIRLSGAHAVRGSSTRGGTTAARELLELAAKGLKVGLTPDGPKGPARKVKSGTLYLALRSGRPILPISNAISRKHVIEKAWDRFQVPLPFARACVVHAPPIWVRDESELAAKARELEEALDRITAEADRWAAP